LVNSPKYQGLVPYYLGPKMAFRVNRFTQFLTRLDGRNLVYVVSMQLTIWLLQEHQNTPTYVDALERKYILYTLFKFKKTITQTLNRMTSPTFSVDGSN